MTVNRAAHFFSIMRGIEALQLMLVTAMRRHDRLLSQKCRPKFVPRIAALLHRSLLLATSSHFTGIRMSASTWGPMGN
jgi:hypothetical protein